MTVSLAGLERVSVEIRLVVPELPSTTAVSLASSRGGVCAGALRRARHTSKNKTTRRILRFRAKPGTATIPNTARIHNGSGRFLQFFSTPSRIPSVMAAVEHAWKRKIRSRRFSRGWLLIFFGESKSSLRGPQDQTTSESKVRGQACRCQRLFAEKDSNRPNRWRSPQQLHRNENCCWMGRSQKVQTSRRSQELVRSENHY